MTANRSVVQETLMGSPDAPRLTRTGGVLIHDTYERFNPDSDPNLEEQVAIATTLLDNWLVTKASDHFSQKIYAGEPLDADQDEVYSTILYPTYRQSQAQYLQESISIVSDVRATEVVLQEAQNSLELKSDTLPAHELRTLRQKATNLEKQVTNARLHAKTKETMFRKIDAFLKEDNFENIDEKVDEIVSAARVQALQQAIRAFESELRLAKVTNAPHDEAAIIEYKLETLRTELIAITGDIPVLSDASQFDMPLAATPVLVEQARSEAPATIIHTDIAFERMRALKNIRPIRALGGLSTALAAFMR